MGALFSLSRFLILLLGIKVDNYSGQRLRRQVNQIESCVSLLFVGEDLSCLYFVIIEMTVANNLESVHLYRLIIRII